MESSGTFERLDSVSTDTIEIELEALERFIAKSRARQMVLLREIDRRQIPLVDGCRTLAEWAGSRLDLSPEIVEAADATPALPCGRCEPHKARMADAPVNLVIDSTGGDAPAITTMVTVLVDARDAAPTNGESGVHTLSGHRLGPAALEAILCDAIVEVNAIAADGRLLGVGGKTRTLPGRLRRLIHQRDRICTADGCISTHRLQPHHIVHRVEGGLGDPSNLTLLCWFHHHVVIHRRGHRIDPTSEPGRIRFLPPEPGTDPPI